MLEIYKETSNIPLALSLLILTRDPHQHILIMLFPILPLLLVPLSLFGTSQAAPTASNAPASSKSTGSKAVASSSAIGPGSGTTEADWIAAHSKAREEYGQPPVTWSTGAADQAVANVEANKGSCGMGDSGDADDYGENWYSQGGKGKVVANKVVSQWMTGAKDFDYNDPEGKNQGELFNPYPAEVFTQLLISAGSGSRSGLFTAIVWKNVTGIACAVGACAVSVSLDCI